MYLKRLELKGFKSFADKSSITLEPGISAIVGPNGSGKSNISDAILWVLGERNAKSLRGAVMEDVIFAGSSSRKPVSMAEVSLVLDNTDGTLPVEYSEVSVSRRLYRSGESEYLINDTPSRRLDVLDILHDSGLGTDTNSIISQGHLDSILQSKPADRRSLIEEAAGVLKHKQRKIRSEHKLERMDQNLRRINDVMAEIERQLKPLRIKAKRAAAYDGLCERLNSLTLKLAVDDLKKIQKAWNEKNASKEKLTKEIEEKREAYSQAEQKLNELRAKISSQSGQIVEHAEKQRRLNSCIEKFDANVLLMEERAKFAQDKLNSISLEEGLSPERRQVLNEIESISTQIKELEIKQKDTQANLDEAKEISENSSEQLQNLQKEYDQLIGKDRSTQSELENLRTKITHAQDDIVEAQAKTATATERINDLNVQISTQEENLNGANDEAEKKHNALNKVKEKSDTTKKRLAELEDKQNQASAEVDKYNSQLQDAKASILALEQILKSSYEEASSASKWLEAHKNTIGKIKNLSDEIDVEDKYLSLVETLLGNYSTSFIAESGSDVIKIDDALKGAEDAEGSVRLVVNSHINLSKQVGKACKKLNAVSLYDEVSVEGKKSVLGALANVVVFDTSFEAFRAANEFDELICASLDGSIIYPDGRSLIGSPFYVDSAFDSDSKRTILSYKKNLKKLNKSVSKTNKELDRAKLQLDKLNTEIKSLREEELTANHKVAMAQAEYDIATNKLNDITNNIDSLKQKLESAQKEKEKLEEAYLASAPEIEANKKKVAELEEAHKTDAVKLEEISHKLSEARDENNIKKSEYNELVINKTTIDERLFHAKDSLDKANARQEKFEKQELENKSDYKTNKLVLELCTNMADIFKKLSICAKRDLDVIDKDAGEISSEAALIQKQSDEANNACMEARRAFDNSREEINEVNIEIAKLEVQVQNSVDAIDKIEGITVDEALKLPDLEDRQETEEQAFRLRRRIANMGTINPDAKHDYDELKERYDFLDEQVQDLRSARTSLKDITKIIDERMKDDFINTFDVVNKNFTEIFAILFPGGQAKLELEETEDEDNAGVEVKAQPRGKHITKMSLLSGGEKSLTALCLLFAVYKTRTTPFYILDEVEAALDDTNLQRLIKYLSELRHQTQLIMITHQRRTMEMANVLYGVSMRGDGVTKVVSQKLEK